MGTEGSKSSERCILQTLSLGLKFKVMFRTVRYIGTY